MRNDQFSALCGFLVLQAAILCKIAQFPSVTYFVVAGLAFALFVRSVTVKP